MAKTARVTPQKMQAAAAFHAMGDAVKACEVAGYTRPDRAAVSLFGKGADGTYKDAAIASELRRLAGDADHESEALDGLDFGELSVEVLRSIASDKGAPATARVQAAKALQPAREMKHRDDMVEGEECSACGFVKGADGDTAAESIKRLLGIAA